MLAETEAPEMDLKPVSGTGRGGEKRREWEGETKRSEGVGERKRLEDRT